MPNSAIARFAKKASNLMRIVTMVNRKTHDTPVFRDCFWFLANPTDTVLGGEHRLELFYSHTVVAAKT